MPPSPVRTNQPPAATLLRRLRAMSRRPLSPSHRTTIRTSMNRGAGRCEQETCRSDDAGPRGRGAEPRSGAPTASSMCRRHRGRRSTSPGCCLALPGDELSPPSQPGVRTRRQRMPALGRIGHPHRRLGDRALEGAEQVASPIPSTARHGCASAGSHRAHRAVPQRRRGSSSTPLPRRRRDPRGRGGARQHRGQSFARPPGYRSVRPAARTGPARRLARTSPAESARRCRSHQPLEWLRRCACRHFPAFADLFRQTTAGTSSGCDILHLELAPICLN
jgi:hypothetical protein